MWTISKLTIKEILYKRIFTVIFILSLVFLIFYGMGTYFAQSKVVDSGGIGMDVLANLLLSTQLYGMGLYFSTFIISLLAIFSAASSISKEIESMQMDPMLSRPLSRASFVMGRFLGLSGLMLFYSTFMFGGVTLINQLVGGKLKMMMISMGQYSQALMLFLLLPIVLIALSLFFSTRFSSLNSGIVMVMLYVITMIGGFVEQLGALIKDQTMINIGIVSSLLFPLDSLFRKMTICLFDAADNPLSVATQGIFSSASAPSNFMIFYAILYGVMAIVLAIRSFVARDL